MPCLSTSNCWPCHVGRYAMIGSHVSNFRWKLVEWIILENHKKKFRTKLVKFKSLELNWYPYNKLKIDLVISQITS